MSTRTTPVEDDLNTALMDLTEDERRMALYNLWGRMTVKDPEACQKSIDYGIWIEAELVKTKAQEAVNRTRGEHQEWHITTGKTNCPWGCGDASGIAGR